MSFIPQVLEYANIRAISIDANEAPADSSAECDKTSEFAKCPRFLSALKYGDADPIRVIFQADTVRKFFVARALWPTSSLNQSQLNDLENFVNLANSKLIFGVFESVSSSDVLNPFSLLYTFFFSIVR